MDVTKFLNAAADAVDAVERMTPLAQSLGIPAVLIQVATVAGGLLEVATNVKERIDDSKVVASNDDHAAVLAILSRVQAVNDQLAVYIAAS